MPSFRMIDSHAVSDEEYWKKDIGRQLALRSTGGIGERIMLESRAQLDFTQPAASPPILALDGVTPLPPIGFGLPMTIDVRHAYSGRVGIRNIDGTGDLALVSGVKDWSVFKATGRALNYVSVHQGKRSNLAGPNALVDGTRVVAYQKAVTTRQVNATVEIVAAGKADGIPAQLGHAFTTAAGIPLLMPHAGLLLAAGQLVPLVGKLANALFGGGSSSSKWTENAAINFDLPGTKPSVAELRLITANQAEFNGYTYSEGRGFVDANGNSYEGDDPYVVLAIYGGPNPDLEAFTPAVAGGDFVSRFYDAQQGSGAVLDELVSLMKVASDIKFRDQAVVLKKQVDAAVPDSEEAKLLKTKLAAALANISDPAFKPAN